MQRGEISILSRRARARAAVENGADLVLELPVPFSCSCAEVFAKTAVGILKRIGIDELIFGSEITDRGALCKAARYSAAATKGDGVIAELVRRGESYPSAMYKAACKSIAPAAASVFKSPNATLGLEYIKALGGIPFTAVPRTCEHDGKQTGSFKSSMELREMLRRGEDISGFAPNGYKNAGISDVKKIERALIFDILTKSREKLLCVPDVNDELADRLKNAAKLSAGFDELVEKTKAKAFTAARIRRCILNSFLGVTEDDLKLKAYLRPLAANERGIELMKSAADCSPSLKTLEENYPRLCELSEAAARLFDLSTDSPACVSDYSGKFIKVRCNES